MPERTDSPATTADKPTADPTDGTAPAVVEATEHEASNAEAARYRRRLREVEAAHSALTEKLAKLQRAEVERLAADKLAKPEDLWLLKPELAELFTDAGDVDPEKVTAAVEAVIEERPSWRVQRVVDFDGGPRGGPVAPAPSWADVIGGSQR